MPKSKSSRSSSSDSSSSDSSSSSGSSSGSSSSSSSSNSRSRSSSSSSSSANGEARKRRPNNAEADRRRSRSPSAAKRRQSPVKSSKIHVGHLTRNVTKDHVQEIFGTYGTLKYVDMPMDRVHPYIGRGFCYVEFEKPEDAEKACKYMNEGQIDGQEVRVNVVQAPSRPRYPNRASPQRRPRYAGGGGGGRRSPDRRRKSPERRRPSPDRRRSPPRRSRSPRAAPPRRPVGRSRSASSGSK